MQTKSSVTTSGPNVGCDALDSTFTIAIPSGGTLLAGTPILRDPTALAGGILPQDQSPSRQFFNGRQTDRGVLATTTGAGDVLGVFQGVGNGLGKNYIPPAVGVAVNPVLGLRMSGDGVVLAGAVAAGTAVTVGSQLIVTSANTFATVGSPTIGRYIGRVIAYPINTRIPLAIATGSQTVTPLSMAGINVGSSLTIDTSSQQEIVVVTAVTATTFTAVFALAHGIGAAVQGITNANGSSILAVPASGSNAAVVYVDINAR